VECSPDEAFCTDLHGADGYPTLFLYVDGKRIEECDDHEVEGVIKYLDGLGSKYFKVELEKLEGKEKEVKGWDASLHLPKGVEVVYGNAATLNEGQQQPPQQPENPPVDHQGHEQQQKEQPVTHGDDHDVAGVQEKKPKILKNAGVGNQKQAPQGDYKPEDEMLPSMRPKKEGEDIQKVLTVFPSLFIRHALYLTFASSSYI
jgi:hypothetical protein